MRIEDMTAHTRPLRSLQEAERNAAAAIERAAPPTGRAAQLVKAAQRAPTARQRVIWLQRAASAWAEPLDQVSACAPGCNHCCHISVMISDTEARLLGEAVGVQPQTPGYAPLTAELSGNVQLHGAPKLEALYNDPCPFLQDGMCGVYAHRPLACRTHINLDVDSALCRLMPGDAPKVPYADASELKAFHLVAQPSARWADIRAFFPPGNRPTWP